MQNCQVNIINESSSLIKKLNDNGETAVVGIQNENGIYTVVGYEKVYYSTLSGGRYEILINDFLDILTLEALKNGKSYTYEYIKVKDNEDIWVMDIHTMNALWNTMLLFDTRNG